MTSAARHSFVWAAVSYGAGRILVFLVTLVLARMLTPDDFGVVAAGLALIAFFEIALDLGLGSAVVYEQEGGVSERVQTAFTLNLLAAGGLTLVGVLAAPTLARFVSLPQEGPLLAALFLSLLIRGAGQIQDAIMRRDLAFRARTGVELLRAVVRGVVSIASAAAGAGPWALVAGLLAGELVGTVASWVVTRFRPTFRLDLRVARGLLRYGSAVVALKVTGVLIANTDYLVVGHQLGRRELGYYSVAYRLPELLLTSVYVIFSTVAFPLYSRARETDASAFKEAMLRALGLVTLFGLPVGTGLALVAEDAVLVLFGDQWQPAAAPLVLLALALGVSAVGYASGDIFAAAGRPGTLVAIAAPFTVAAVVAFVLAAPYGLVAVAAVHLVFNLAYGAVRLLVANRLVGSSLRESLAAMRPGLLVSVAVAVAALPVLALLPPGPTRLLAVVATGSLAGAAALRFGAPRALGELRALAGRAG